MKRRSFVKASLLVPTIPAAAFAGTTSAQKTAREYYELRVYTLKDATQQQMVADYYQHAAIPAYNKTGSKNIGVFTELKPEGQTKLFVVIPYKSIEDFSSAKSKLMNDKTYIDAASAYLHAPATAPAYERIESSLLYAFPRMPEMATTTPDKPRIFELRRYESPTEAAGMKKIEMFNEGGEMDIFKKTGLDAVFYGQSLIGGNQPNLTYMLQFDDMADHDKSWGTFGSSPEWNKLKSIPDYADAKLISKITAIFLTPTSFSQI
ncbi:NIPSNAP family containing protein [Ilyomonas limi]|uniref:NIPSNAP family containing protein n=1 Tax=Ilyomonas limi TaxID=2575867 RepID=A0A4U3KZX8_9BACT|nr:NIPSNAP family protein [Ilyomonas limi]TKK68228.1 NIPSNAP family containing protein [Ilyomonas limi]